MFASRSSSELTATISSSACALLARDSSTRPARLRLSSFGERRDAQDDAFVELHAIDVLTADGLGHVRGRLARCVQAPQQLPTLRWRAARDRRRATSRARVRTSSRARSSDRRAAMLAAWQPRIALPPYAAKCPSAARSRLRGGPARAAGTPGSALRARCRPSALPTMSRRSAMRSSAARSCSSCDRSTPRSIKAVKRRMIAIAKRRRGSGSRWVAYMRNTALLEHVVLLEAVDTVLRERTLEQLQEVRRDACTLRAHAPQVRAEARGCSRDRASPFRRSGARARTSARRP